MADLAFATGDSQTVKLWGKDLLKTALGQTLFFKKFLGTNEDAVMYWAKDLEKNNGDSIAYDLLAELEGDGITGSNELEGNEENLDFQQDTILIDQLRHATGRALMSSQRSVHDLRAASKFALSRWWARKFESYMFRYLCGDITINHAQTGTTFTSNNVIYSGDATGEGDMGNNDQFTLADIDYCVEKAKTKDKKMIPIMIEGKLHYIMVLHPYSVTDLKLNVGGASTSIWMDIQKEAALRGKSNGIFTGALGVYNNTILFESPDIYASTTTIRRNIFLAARAGCFALGNAYDGMDQKKYGKDNFISWHEYTRDAGDKKYVKAGSVFGVKKNVFDSEDYGVITVPSYATAAS